MPHTNEDTEKEIENEEVQTEDLQPNLQTGSITVQKDGHFIHCLTVIGQIEGHYILPSQNKTTKYEHVIPQLVAIEESDDVEGLLIILNTVGGDVEAGLAIAELLSTMRTPTASLVLGGGHSIGVPLAVSCRRSFIVPSATMTVHPVRMNGLVLGVPQTLSYFEKMQDRIVRFIAHNAKISADDFRALMMKTGELVMDVGTVLGFLPMVLLLVPAGKYGNVYGLFRSMGYNGTLLDEGVFFALTGGLILLALLQMKKHGPQKNVDWYAALILGFAAAFSLPIAGLSYMGALFCLGVMMGVARKISYRFAAVSSVLTLLVLGVVEICTCVTYVNIIAGILAVVLSAAVTYFMVKLMLWILHGGKLKAFAYYDFALAGVCVVVGIFELILR